MSIEKVQREVPVTRTETRWVSIVTCDLCGRVDESLHVDDLADGWLSLCWRRPGKDRDDDGAHLCPACATLHINDMLIRAFADLVEHRGRKGPNPFRFVRFDGA